MGRGWSGPAFWAQTVPHRFECAPGLLATPAMSSLAPAPRPRRLCRPARRQRSRGFTLIEQLAVIVAAGATSAVALPRFIELQAATEQAALASLAGAAASGMVLNQAGCLITDQRAAPGRCMPVADCADAAALLLAELPEGYRIEPQAIALPSGRGNGSAATCRMVQLASGATKNFIGLAAGRSN